MRKKIAYIGIKGLPSKAGADRVVEAIVQRLDDRYYQPIVYCSRRVVDVETEITGVRLIILPTLPGKHFHATSLFFFAALHAPLFGNYHLVHLHNVEASFILPLLRLRYKVVSTSHGVAQSRDKWNKLDKFLIRLTEYPFIKLSNYCTSVSKTLASFYQQKYKREVMFLPNGVDADIEVDRESALNLLARINVKPGQFVLFAAGRVIVTKGCHLLLQAFRGLDTDSNLIIVGDTSQLPKYERQLRDLADGRAHFIPFISKKEVLFGLYSSARIFVFPSTVEAMSMVLLEVSALGIPIICSDIPENRSVLSEFALYFKSGDSDDLAEKLNWALQHPQEMQTLAINAQRRVHQIFRWDIIVEQYQAIYEAIGAKEQVPSIDQAFKDHI